MERELDINEGGYRLDGALVLRVIQEVSNARLEMRVPLEDIKLRVLHREERA